MNGGSQTQTTQTGLDPQSEAYRNWGYGQYQNLAGRAGQAYGGQLTAGMNPLFNQAVAGGLGAIPGQQAAWNPLAQGMAGSAGVLQNMALHPEQFSGQGMNPYIQNVIGASNQAFDLARRQGMSQLGEQAGSAFGRGSRQSVAEGSLMSQLGLGQAQTTAGLMNQGYNDAYTRWQNALQLRASIAGGNVSAGAQALGQQQALGQYGTGLGMQAGDYARSVQQQGLTNQYNEFQRQYGAPAQIMGAGQGLLGAAGRNSTTTMTQQSDPFGQILGAGLSLGGMALGGPVGGAVGAQLGQQVMGGGWGGWGGYGGWGG